jgi:hypothetical protein
MIVAYLILAHRDPEQLARLVHALPLDSPIMIHIDRRSEPAMYERSLALLGRRPGLRLVQQAKCRWGSFGIVQGTINLIRAAIEDGVQCDYATLLSGSDYPVKSNTEITTFLNQNRGKEFIESFSLTDPNMWSDAGGYYKAPDRLLCPHLRFRSKIVRIPIRRTMPLGLKPFGGPQWWTLSRPALQYIIRFIEDNPSFVSFSKLAFIPDETFIQTILSNSDFAKHVTGDNLRLIVWDRPKPPYPAILIKDDLSMLLSTTKLFARKFDCRIDADILQALDRRNAEAEIHT